MSAHVHEIQTAPDGTWLDVTGIGEWLDGKPCPNDPTDVGEAGDNRDEVSIPSGG